MPQQPTYRKDLPFDTKVHLREGDGWGGDRLGGSSLVDWRVSGLSPTSVQPKCTEGFVYIGQTGKAGGLSRGRGHGYGEVVWLRISFKCIEGVGLCLVAGVGGSSEQQRPTANYIQYIVLAIQESSHHRHVHAFTYTYK